MTFKQRRGGHEKVAPSSPRKRRVRTGLALLFGLALILLALPSYDRLATDNTDAYQPIEPLPGDPQVRSVQEVRKTYGLNENVERHLEMDEDHRIYFRKNAALDGGRR